MRRDGLLPRMEAYQRKAGGFTYRYHPVGGKPINLGHDRDEAIRKVLDLNGGASPYHGTLKWLWDQWKAYSPRWKRIKDGTKADYELAWKQINARLGTYPVEAITPAMVGRYVLVDRASAPRRADIEKTLISNLFKYAVTVGAASINPADNVEGHGDQRKPKVMPQETVLSAFLAWLEKQTPQRRVIGRMAEFASLVGARRVEFLDVTWAQVDLDRAVVRLPRAKQRGADTVWDVVHLSPALRALLERLPRDGAYLFTTRDGNPYTTRGFKTLWQRCMLSAIEAGVVTEKTRFTFHSLRRFYATTHKQKTGKLPDMHANPQVTASVYDGSREVPREAV